jgi:hypothetical protein
MTDANRAEAQAELRESIANAFAEKTLWTTDWAGVQLKRCGLSSLQAELQISVTCNIQPDAQSSPGAQLPETQNVGVTRFQSSHSPLMLYRADTPPMSKKAKKAAAQKRNDANLDFGDQAALNRRAERFQREHDIERQKSMRGQASLQANHQNAHLFNRISRSDSPSAFGTNADDPEADPVRPFSSAVNVNAYVIA